MGFPSLYENIQEKVNESLSSMLRDEEQGARRRSKAEEETRLSAIRKVQKEIGVLLYEQLEIATTPGLDLVEEIRRLRFEITQINTALECANAQLAQERQHTRAALESVAQRDAKIAEQKKENERLEMKVAFLGVKENGGRSIPVKARR